MLHFLNVCKQTSKFYLILLLHASSLLYLHICSSCKHSISQTPVYYSFHANNTIYHQMHPCWDITSVYISLVAILTLWAIYLDIHNIAKRGATWNFISQNGKRMPLHECVINAYQTFKTFLLYLLLECNESLGIQCHHCGQDFADSTGGKASQCKATKKMLPRTPAE